jgi:hypothetical protein
VLYNGNGYYLYDLYYSNDVLGVWMEDVRSYSVKQSRLTTLLGTIGAIHTINYPLKDNEMILCTTNLRC